MDTRDTVRQALVTEIIRLLVEVHPAAAHKLVWLSGGSHRRSL
ncbi:hypothetical protein [Burkholderia ubonensis]|nr:hypothetical protein [Burkholderia ubonensis]